MWNSISRRTTVLLLWSLLLVVGVKVVHSQFNEPPGQRREQTFKVLEFENGNINQRFEGTLRYYCTFRGKWSEERHPIDFPKSPSWSAPVMISHSNGYRMWTGTETATLGVESIAEEGFPTIITNEFANAGFETLQLVLGERMFNTTESQHLPPINVTFEHPFISSMAKITPSPDWFVGFSDFRTISYDTETYYNRIVIQSFVWDCGTDGGQTYTALDRDLDPQIPVERMRPNTVPFQGQFLDPTGTYIPIPAEYECVLRVGEGPVIPGHPFNDTHIRPPLYVPRDDDFWMGLPPCKRGNKENCWRPIDKENYARGQGGPISGTTTATVIAGTTWTVVATIVGLSSLMLTMM